MSVPVIRATHSTEREYLNDKGETCRDVTIHCSVLELRKKVGDAKAAQIYADAFNKDPDFYDFYRAMQSYRYTFAQDAKGQTSLVLSPDNAYLKEFQGRR